MHLEWIGKAVDHFGCLEDIRFLFGIILLDGGYDPTLRSCGIFCRIDSDFQISQCLVHAEDVAGRHLIACQVIAPASGIADDEIRNGLGRVPLAIVDIACEVGADVVSVVEALPGLQIRIAGGIVVISDGVVVNGEYFLQRIIVQLLSQPGLLAFGKESDVCGSSPLALFGSGVLRTMNRIPEQSKE
jgi:hypothetical protein